MRTKWNKHISSKLRHLQDLTSPQWVFINTSNFTWRDFLEKLTTLLQRGLIEANIAQLSTWQRTKHNLSHQKKEVGENGISVSAHVVWNKIQWTAERPFRLQLLIVCRSVSCFETYIYHTPGYEHEFVQHNVICCSFKITEVSHSLKCVAHAMSVLSLGCVIFMFSNIFSKWSLTVAY